VFGVQQHNTKELEKKERLGEGKILYSWEGATGFRVHLG